MSEELLEMEQEHIGEKKRKLQEKKKKKNFQENPQ